MDLRLSATQFEIHPNGAGDLDETGPLPWRESAPPSLPPPFTVTEGGGLVWATVGAADGRLERVASEEQAAFALRVARRRLNAELVLVALRRPVLVNGVPAPPLAVLAVGDSLVLGPGQLAYVTERVRPYVGPPVGDLIGKRCPHCRIPAKPDSRVVTHRCGALFHLETAESHPHLPESERLNCFAKLSACLSCNRPLTLHPYLVWDPRSL